jgi:hypothetical protein
MIGSIRRALARFLATVLTVVTLGRVEVNRSGSSRFSEGSSQAPLSKKVD